MASIGIHDKKFYSAVNFFDRKPDMVQDVIDIQNELGVEYDLPDILGNRHVPLENNQPTYENTVNDALFTVGDTTGATIVGSGSARTLTGVTLTAATSGFARINDFVTLPNGQQAIITAKTTASSQDTLTLKNVESGNLTLVAGGLLVIGSNAQYEQSGAQESRRYLPTKYSNKWQIFSEFDQITDVEKVAKKEVNWGGQPYVMYINHVRKLQSLKMQIAYQYIAGKMSETSFSDASASIADANGHTFQTTRGLNDYIGTYGQAPTLSAAGTITNADLRNLVKKLAAARCPKKYMVWMNTESKTIFDEYLKGLGSSSVTKGQLSLDGAKLNMQATGFEYGGFDFDLSVLPILDHKELFNFTGSAGLQKQAYFVPKEMKVKVEGGGGYVDRIRVRYLSRNPVEGGEARGIISEINTGLLAPVPSGDDMSHKTKWITYQGLECLGVQHFAKMQISA